MCTGVPEKSAAVYGYSEQARIHKGPLLLLYYFTTTALLLLLYYCTRICYLKSLPPSILPQRTRLYPQRSFTAQRIIISFTTSLLLLYYYCFTTALLLHTHMVSETSATVYGHSEHARVHKGGVKYRQQQTADKETYHISKETYYIEKENYYHNHTVESSR